MNLSAQSTITCAQMRALEMRAMASGEVSGLELMERAGEGVVHAMSRHWPKRMAVPASAEILCGPGNNGGDGYVVARLLRDAGWEVTIIQVGYHARLPPDAAENARRWAGPCVAHDVFDGPPRAHPALMIDAVFGIGLSRPIEDPALWEWFWSIDDSQDARAAPGQGPLEPPLTLAIDLPSGLDGDTGAVLGGNAPAHGLRAPRVDLTVTFHAKKPAHVMGEGAELCGQVEVVDIGLGPWDDGAGAGGTG